MKKFALSLLPSAMVFLMLSNFKTAAQQNTQNKPKESVVAFELAGMKDVVVKKDVPILIVHAGKDFVPHTNESLTGFVDKAINLNLPITVINYANGVHGFDVYADNETTREIIKNTLEFLKFYLKQ
jgi:alpha-beta hydrolase superfamily lysophospholipase